jgi:ketosteroid isomerase-like protein
MSQESVEIITRMYRAWNSGDMDALANVFDVEVEVRPALSTFRASTVFRGRDGVAAWYPETFDSWAEMRAEPQHFLDAGERTVVVFGLHARVPGGKVDLDAEIAHVVTIRDGRIVKLDGYDAPGAALSAVGLDSQ